MLVNAFGHSNQNTQKLNIMKKLLSLAFLLCASLQALAIDQWTDSNGVLWTFTVIGDEAEGIAPYDKNSISGAVVIPSKVYIGASEYTVMSIGQYAFSGCTSLTSATIPNGIRKIGYGAFRDCIGLTNITIPNSVWKIDNLAFWGCSNLSYVDLSEGLTNIGQYSFYGCSNIKSLTIPSSMQNIDIYAFEGCSGLTRITIPSSVKNIGVSAFFACTGLIDVTINSNAIMSKDYTSTSSLYKIFGDQVQEYTIGNGVTKIGDYAFSNSTSLNSVVFPSSVTSIGENVFYGCNLLNMIIYLSPIVPQNWIATTFTYVPDKLSYSNPPNSINNAQVFEMISFNQTEFDYSVQTVTPNWTNNMEDYAATLTSPIIDTYVDTGSYESWIPVTFTKEEKTITADVVFRYLIKPAKLTATVPNVIREYGEENPSLNIIYSGFIGDDNQSVVTTNPTVSTAAQNTSNVGEYPITVSGGSAKNYEFVYEPGVLTVTKAPLSAKVNDATKVYGTKNPTFTIEYYGLKNNENVPAWTTTPTFQTDATQQSGVGQYMVTAVDGVPKNYILEEILDGTLTVTAASLTITANNANRQYYDNDPVFSYICNGFVNGDDESVLSYPPELSTTATLTSGVGTYDIIIGETASPNYSISYVSGILTITPRTLNASVGNYERTYNEENPVFIVEYDGFVGSDDEDILITRPIAQTTANKTSDVGNYTINVSGGVADNYSFSYSSGILTINKAEQEIIWEQDFDNVNVGDQLELLAYTTSGLPIDFNLSDYSLGTVYSANGKYYLDCLNEGILVIKALQEGDKNYYSAVRVSKTIIIGNASGIDAVDMGTISSDIPVYNLMGTRVEVMEKGHIYILNGKKILVK